MKTGIYNIKVGRGKWEMVRATSIKALSDWCKANNIADWQMIGMMSRAELEQSKSLRVVA